MKLNPECIRSVMLQLEKLPYGEVICQEELYDLLPNYSHDEIIYTVLKIHEARFINATVTDYASGEIRIDIDDITYNGHQFINNISSNKVWETTKKVAADIGSNSIQAISQIAISVVTTLINQHLGL